jgi:N-methylhydantoinase A
MKPASAGEIDAVFQEEHKRRYGYARATLKTQVVNLRARIIQHNHASLKTPVPPASASRERKDILLNGKRWDALFLARAALGVGETIVGPAVLEEETSTTFVPPDWRCTCLPEGDLLLEKS